MLSNGKSQALRQRNCEIAQQNRDLKKKQIKSKIKTYTLFNDICKIFKEQEWVPSAFKQGDIALEGERKEKNRIASRNSRVRAKGMEAELDSRIVVLERALEPTFMPLDFAFPFEEDVELKVFSDSHGKWVCQGQEWIKEY
jgi:hypothetical protein